MPTKHRIVPCLWFDNQAEEASRYYVSIFKNAKIGKITHYSAAGFDVHQRPAGSVRLSARNGKDSMRR